MHRLTACGKGCGGIFTIQTLYGIIDSGREALHTCFGKRAGSDALVPSEERGGTAWRPNPKPEPTLILAA